MNPVRQLFIAADDSVAADSAVSDIAQRLTVSVAVAITMIRKRRRHEPSFAYPIGRLRLPSPTHRPLGTAAIFSSAPIFDHFFRQALGISKNSLTFAIAMGD